MSATFADLLSLPAVNVACKRAVLEYGIELDESGYDEVLSTLAPALLKSPLLYDGARR
jgi:hypothetical protein